MKPTRLVVTYHYIRDQNSDGCIGISTDDFRAQLELIQHHYKVVTCEEYVSGSGPGTALISFDDGLKDQWEAACILHELGVPAVFFVPMGPLSQSRGWCTQHLVHAAIHEHGWENFSRFVEPGLSHYPYDEEAAESLYHYEEPRKRRIKYQLAFVIPSADVVELLPPVKAGPGDWYMDGYCLREIQEMGHSLGGHGFWHSPYSRMTTLQQAADMHRSQARMSELFGAMPRAMSLPFGRATAETRVIARACGYTHCFGTDERVDAKYLRRVLA